MTIPLSLCFPFLPRAGEDEFGPGAAVGAPGVSKQDAGDDAAGRQVGADACGRVGIEVKPDGVIPPGAVAEDGSAGAGEVGFGGGVGHWLGFSPLDKFLKFAGDVAQAAPRGVGAHPVAFRASCAVGGQSISFPAAEDGGNIRQVALSVGDGFPDCPFGPAGRILARKFPQVFGNYGRDQPDFALVDGKHLRARHFSSSSGLFLRRRR